MFLDAWCVRTSLRIGWQTISREDVREGVVARCERCGCALYPTYGGSSPTMFTLFCGLCLKMGLVVLMFLTSHTVIPSKYLYVFVS